MFARPLIDGVDFALNGRELRGNLPLDALPRLKELLANERGEIAFLLRGYAKDSHLMLDVELGGECRLRCQRCLGELLFPVAMASSLRLAPPGEIDAVDMEDETECIETSTRIDVLSLVEDELLLGMPYAPRHPAGKCLVPENALNQSASPFAVLANRIKKH
ncbi:YceD family protein [Ferrigenium sp. UT5]|uniref:YceD family protein n=1 Tax=Ferrigenium sp. UT5 TaxID=3242105 RepID=UPI003552B6E3